MTRGHDTVYDPLLDTDFSSTDGREKEEGREGGRVRIETP